MSVRTWKAAGLITALACCGCARSPSFNILGSYFPGWIVSMLIGIVLATVLHWVLYRMRLEDRLPLAPLLYVAVSVICACGFWLLIFD